MLPTSGSGWTHLLLPGTAIAKAQHQDGSFTNIYEIIPENKFPEVINCLITASLNALSTAAILSAGKCYLIQVSRGVVKTHHFCVGPLTSNRGSIVDEGNPELFTSCHITMYTHKHYQNTCT